MDNNRDNSNCVTHTLCQGMEYLVSCIATGKYHLIILKNSSLGLLIRCDIWKGNNQTQDSLQACCNALQVGLRGILIFAQDAILMHLATTPHTVARVQAVIEGIHAVLLLLGTQSLVLFT